LCCRLVPPNLRIVDPACGDSVLVPRIGVRGRLARAFAVPCRSWRPPSQAPSPDNRLPYRYTVAARCAHSRCWLAFPLHSNSPPSPATGFSTGWVWDLISYAEKAMLIAPFRIRAVPGTQPADPADGLRATRSARR